MCQVKRNDYVRHENQNKLHAEDLSTEQRQFLLQLDNKLVDTEKGIKKECLALMDQLEKRLNDANDWLEDYEIECDISFYLQDDDPDYDEGSDNILVKLWEDIKFEDWAHGIGDGRNHNEYQHWDHPMKDEHHCWLFHCLYDHTELGWINMLRIGSIWVDIKVRYQKLIEL